MRSEHIKPQQMKAEIGTGQSYTEQLISNLYATPINIRLLRNENWDFDWKGHIVRPVRINYDRFQSFLYKGIFNEGFQIMLGFKRCDDEPDLIG